MADELYAILESNLGAIRVRLFPQDAPETVANFVGLAQGTKEWTDPRTGARVTRPLYEGTLFHRVIPEFMIQGGDPLGKGTGGPGFTYADEISARKFDRPGILAMANRGAHTNGSQFFITEVAAPWLNGKHTIFGEVVEGMEGVRAIARVRRGPMDRPEHDVILQRVIITDKK